MSTPEKRTLQQNKAAHKYFDMLAESLNDAGLDMKKTLKPEVDIPWSKETVKEYLFKPLAEAMFNVEHTADLTTKQISEVYDVLNRHTGQKLGVSVEWPSDEPPMIGE